MKLSLFTLALMVLPLQTPPTEPPVEPPAEPPTTAVEKPEPPSVTEGLWPSPRMRDLLLSRWVDQVGHRFALDENQTDQLRESFVKRWGGYIGDNRSKLKPLVNEFLEMRLGREPPSREQVERWSREALPMFKKTRAKFDEGKADFREVLSPLQRAKFEIRALEFTVGMDLLEQRLTQISVGTLDDETRDMFWEPPGLTRTQRRKRREAQRRKQADAVQQASRAIAVATDRIVLELSAWEQYAIDFIGQYNLNEGQRTTARSCLSELTERARAHRDRYHTDIKRIEHRIAEFTGSDKELTALKEKLTELYGPIDDMFKELRLRFDQIPTATQRAKVDQKQQETSQANDPPALPSTPNN